MAFLPTLTTVKICNQFYRNFYTKPTKNLPKQAVYFCLFDNNLLKSPSYVFATFLLFMMTNFLNRLPFAHHGWFMYLRLLVRHFLADNCTQKAASLTYTTLLSLVPMFAVLLVIFSTVPALESVRIQVQEAIYNNLLPSSSRQVSEYINSFAQNSAKMTLVGVGALLFTTIMTLITIETAFNQIWRVEEQSGGLKSVVRYVLMVIGTPIILAIAFAASSAIKGMDFVNRQILGYGIDWAIWAQGLSFVLTAGGFVLLYWFVPKVNVPKKNALIAGIVIAIVFEAVKRFFGLAVNNFTSYEAVYGAFAALPVFLLWIYLSWNLILLGVEISYTLTIFDKQDVPVRHPLLSLLDMLNLIYKNHEDSKTTSEQALRDVLGQKELPKWQTYIAQLQTQGLITQDKAGNYALKTNLDTISLWQFHRLMPYPLPIKEELFKLKTADYDPWYVEIYDRLAQLEQEARHTLNAPLSYLFDTTPIRPKRDIDTLKTSPINAHDIITEQDASFSHNATQVQMATDRNKNALIPEGEKAFGIGTLGKIARYVKLARHTFGRSKGIIKDIRRGMK